LSERCGDVVAPTIGRGRGGVDYPTRRALDGERKWGEKPLLLIRKRTSCPVERRARVVVELAIDTFDRSVVVALDGHRAFGGKPHDGVDDRDRVCAVADEVAEQGMGIRTPLASVREASLERLAIGMNVG